MVYDNRYFPWYLRTFSRTVCKPSNMVGDLFLLTANDAFLDNDDSGGIPEIWGKYDLTKLANALVKMGNSNPFIGTQFEQYINQELPFKVKGKIEGQGVAFNWNQYVTDNVSIGASWFAMHVFSRMRFRFDSLSIGLDSDQLIMLDALRRSIQNSLGLYAPKFSRAGFSDIDLYVRFGNLWNYSRKFRRIDAGGRLGLYIPTGLTREVNNPASLPFGGNGHWGVYAQTDLEFELKEDWKVGLWLRLIKRFERTKHGYRLPVADEQALFAALLTDALVDPGITFVFSPYVLFEDLRDGLGIQAKYTAVIHEEDSISDPRIVLTGPPPTLKKLNDLTQWRAEYLTLNVFYDFARVRWAKYFAPIVSLMWDIPIQLLIAERVSKTNRISLGVSFSF